MCGRIIAYQFGTPEGFLGYSEQNQRAINDPYIDGISITSSYPRKHIWTFAATIVQYPACSCTRSGSIEPFFVNENHFCEVGRINDGTKFVTSNPLWDGQGCAAFRACYKFNNPPWFYKQLDQPTVEDIELRKMGNVNKFNFLEEEDTPVEVIEILFSEGSTWYSSEVLHYDTFLLLISMVLCVLSEIQLKHIVIQYASPLKYYMTMFS